MGHGFSPFAGARQACWHCRWWAGYDGGGVHGRCGRRGACPVQATPADGCAFFEREPGSDDEPGPPAPPPRRAIVPFATARSAS